MSPKEMGSADIKGNGQEQRNGLPLASKKENDLEEFNDLGKLGGGGNSLLLNGNAPHDVSSGKTLECCMS